MAALILRQQQNSLLTQHPSQQDCLYISFLSGPGLYIGQGIDTWSLPSTKELAVRVLVGEGLMIFYSGFKE